MPALKESHRGLITLMDPWRPVTVEYVCGEEVLGMSE